MNGDIQRLTSPGTPDTAWTNMPILLPVGNQVAAEQQTASTARTRQAQQSVQLTDYSYIQQTDGEGVVAVTVMFDVAFTEVPVFSHGMTLAEFAQTIAGDVEIANQAVADAAASAAGFVWRFPNNVAVSVFKSYQPKNAISVPENSHYQAVFRGTVNGTSKPSTTYTPHTYTAGGDTLTVTTVSVTTSLGGSRWTYKAVGTGNWRIRVTKTDGTEVATLDVIPRADQNSSAFLVGDYTGLRFTLYKANDMNTAVADGAGNLRAEFAADGGGTDGKVSLVVTTSKGNKYPARIEGGNVYVTFTDLADRGDESATWQLSIGGEVQNAISGPDTGGTHNFIIDAAGYTTALKNLDETKKSLETTMAVGDPDKFPLCNAYVKQWIADNQGNFVGAEVIIVIRTFTTGDGGNNGGGDGEAT